MPDVVPVASGLAADGVGSGVVSGAAGLDVGVLSVVTEASSSAGGGGAAGLASGSPAVAVSSGVLVEELPAPAEDAGVVAGAGGGV